MTKEKPLKETIEETTEYSDVVSTELERSGGSEGGGSVGSTKFDVLHPTKQMLSPEQLDIFRGLYSLHQGEKPSGFISKQDMLDVAGITKSGLYQLIKRIGVDVFGEVLTYERVSYYSEKQQNMILEVVNLLEEEMPPGSKTLDEMSEEFGISRMALYFRMQSLKKEGDFGDTIRYRERGKRGGGTAVVSKAQVEQLRRQDEEIRKKRGRALLDAAKHEIQD